MTIDQTMDDMVKAQWATNQMLTQIDARLARIEIKIAEYEPLIELVRSKVDRGASWRKRKGNEDG